MGLSFFSSFGRHEDARVEAWVVLLPPRSSGETHHETSRHASPSRGIAGGAQISTVRFRLRRRH